MDEDEWFRKLYNQVYSCNVKQREELQNFLGDMEQSWVREKQTIKAYKKYIKKFKRQNKILFIAFRTRDIIGWFD